MVLSRLQALFCVNDEFHVDKINLQCCDSNTLVPPVVLLLTLCKSPSMVVGSCPGLKTALAVLLSEAQAAAVEAKLVPIICTSCQLALCSSLLCCLSASAFSCMDNKFNLRISMNSSFFTPLSSVAVLQCLSFFKVGVTEVEGPVDSTSGQSEGVGVGLALLSPNSTSSRLNSSSASPAAASLPITHLIHLARLASSGQSGSLVGIFFGREWNVSSSGQFFPGLESEVHVQEPHSSILQIQWASASW